MDEQNVSGAEEPSDNLFSYEEGQIKFERESNEEHNVNLELEENGRVLKKERTSSKRESTKAVNRVSDVLKVGENNDAVEICVRRMDYAFNEFRKACDNYRRSLKDEDDIEECIIYYNEAERR